MPFYLLMLMRFLHCLSAAFSLFRFSAPRRFRHAASFFTLRFLLIFLLPPLPLPWLAIFAASFSDCRLFDCRRFRFADMLRFAAAFSMMPVSPDYSSFSAVHRFMLMLLDWYFSSSLMPSHSFFAALMLMLLDYFSLDAAFDISSPDFRDAFIWCFDFFTLCLIYALAAFDTPCFLISALICLWRVVCFTLCCWFRLRFCLRYDAMISFATISLAICRCWFSYFQPDWYFLIFCLLSDKRFYFRWWYAVASSCCRFSATSPRHAFRCCHIAFSSPCRCLLTLAAAYFRCWYFSATSFRFFAFSFFFLIHICFRTFISLRFIYFSPIISFMLYFHDYLLFIFLIFIFFLHFFLYNNIE